MPKQLYELDAKEVSFVPRGANKRKFLIFKSLEGAMNEELLKLVSQADPETLKKVDAALDTLVQKDDQGKKLVAVLKAVARILTPFKNEISPELIQKTLEAVGVAKAADEDDDDEDEDEEEEPGADQVSKSHKEPTMPVMKADGTLDLSAVEAAARPEIESIFKSHQKLADENKTLVQKAADLEAALNAEREGKTMGECVAKAESFRHYAGDKAELAKQLRALHGTPGFDIVTKALTETDTQKEAVHKQVTAELGSAQGANGTTWEQIEKAAAGLVAKSGEKVSSADAVTKFLGTEEGQKMYAEYKNQRGGI